MALIAPVIATAIVAAPAIASATKSEEIPHLFPSNEANINARYDAYLPVMRSSMAAYPDGRVLTVDQARRIAPIWWSNYQAGRLLPLPQSSSDSTLDGVTGQILRTSSQVDTTLRYSAARLASDGQATQAVNDALLAMEVSRPLKYCDAVSCSLTNADNRRNLHIIASVAADLTPAQRASTIHRLAALRADGPQLESVLSGAYRHYIYQSVRNQTAVINPIRVDNLHNTVAGPSMLRELNALKARFNNESYTVATGSYVGASRRAVSSEQQTEQTFDTTIKALSKA